MTTPAFYGGQSAYLAVNDPSGSLFNWSPYIKSSNFEQSINQYISTTYGQAAETRTDGLPDGKATVSGFLDPVWDRRICTMRGIVAPYSYGPNGNASGKVNRTGSLIIKSIKTSRPVDGLIPVSIDIEFTGPVTKGTY